MGREWVAQGHEVTVVTNFPNHPTGVVPETYRGRSFQVEEVHGLRVIRCRTYATPNRGFVLRTLGHLVFMLQAVLQATPHLRGTDVLVASSPTLFAVVAAWVISRRLGVPFVFEVRDLWPAIFADLGVIRNRTVIRTLRAPGALPLPAQRRGGDGHSRLRCRHRATRDRPARSSTSSRTASTSRPSSRGHRTATCAPAWGSATGSWCSTAAPTASATRSRGSWTSRSACGRIPRFHFLFVGEGAEKEALEAKAHALALENVTFRDAVPREEVPALYRTADVVPRPAARGAALPLLHPLEDVRDPGVREADPRVARGRGGGDPARLGRRARGAARGRGRARGRRSRVSPASPPCGPSSPRAAAPTSPSTSTGASSPRDTLEVLEGVVRAAPVRAL